MMDELAQSMGFSDAAELSQLVASVDISAPEKMAAFTQWRESDGTKAGLLALNEEGPKKTEFKVEGAIGGSLQTTPDIELYLAQHAPVAIGVSGGKDSDAAALATVAYLDRVGHTGPRVLIHADLGRVEWRSSLPQCQRLAEYLGLELIVVRRERGDLMDRWLQRWRDNVARYAALECVKVIMPWSSASMRFCTSELKVAIIWRELARRFAGQTILSVTGIRREESAGRAKAPVSKLKGKLTGAHRGTQGFDWHPIIDWSLSDVLDLHETSGFPLHEAYTRYGNTRVSCAFCILASRPDLLASSTCADNHDIYREMVDLEIASTFSFQDSGWLGDVAPHLLTADQLAGLKAAKRRGHERTLAEALIPAHLLYEKGWPQVMPTRVEARLLAEVRTAVADSLGITVQYTESGAILDRYAELMVQRGTPAQAVTVQETLAL